MRIDYKVERKKVIVTGGSGFAGRHLVTKLLAKRYDVTVIDIMPPRQNQTTFLKMDLQKEVPNHDLFEGVEGVIHLAGKSIFIRWSDDIKKAIYDSRIRSTRNLIYAFEKTSKKPKVFISASAVGFYGDGGEKKLVEQSPHGKDFLARVVIDWEKEADKARHLGIRTIQMRTAPILGRGGLLDINVPFFRLGLGGPLASGRQWFSWIHIDDLVNIYFLSLEHSTLKGPINACSPHPVRNVYFTKSLAKVLKKPTFLSLPRWALRILFSDLADSLIMSQKVYPEKIISYGYHFIFPDIKEALSDIFDKKV